MIIDTHQHFWRYTYEEYSWIKPDRAPLNKDYIPDDALPLMQNAGVKGAVAVEARADDIENHFLLALAETYPYVVGVVGRVDLTKASTHERLEEYAQNPYFCGIRIPLPIESENPLQLNAQFLQGLQLLSGLNLTFDIYGRPRKVEAMMRLFQNYPNLRFVINHMSKPDIKSGEMEPWKTEINQLAQFSNAYCKVSGMLTEADRQNWKMDDFTPYFDALFEAFTPSRLMFGSDWPVSHQAGEYKDTVDVVKHYVNTLSLDEQNQVWFQTAKTVYQFPDE